MHSFGNCSSPDHLQHFPLLFVIIFLMFLQQQRVAPKTLPARAIGAELIRTPGTSLNAPLGETKQQRRHQVVHRNAAFVATNNVTQDARLKQVDGTGRSKNQKQNATGCESIHICVADGHLGMGSTAAILRELRDQIFAARTGKLHGRPRHMSAQSAKLNIMILSGLQFSQTNCVINICGS